MSEPIPPETVEVLAAYGVIKAHYGNRVAQRSGVPLIAHINEGVKILRHREAPFRAVAAYMLHPLVQSDADLFEFMRCELPGAPISVKTWVLTMEYRRSANSFLSFGKPEDYLPSPLPEVKDMLFADKVQNRKDFERYHLHKHVRSKELVRYFAAWMGILDITEKDYREYVKMMDDPKI